MCAGSGETFRDIQTSNFLKCLRQHNNVNLKNTLSNVPSAQCDAHVSNNLTELSVNDNNNNDLLCLNGSDKKPKLSGNKKVWNFKCRIADNTCFFVLDHVRKILLTPNLHSLVDPIQVENVNWTSACTMEGRTRRSFLQEQKDTLSSVSLHDINIDMSDFAK